MDQKNSESLIKWNPADENWQVVHRYNMTSASNRQQEDRVGVRVIDRKDGTQVLSLVVNDGNCQDTECWLDKPSAQALVSKMQELVEGMK